MWYHQNNPISCIEDLPGYEGAVGFTYRITNLITGRIYIGKKSLYSTRKKKISKKEKTETKTRKTFKQVVKESDWAEYYGSSQELLNDIELLGKDRFRRDILEISYSKKHLGYSEVKHQILNQVLETDSYNGNVLGRWFTRDIKNHLCNKQAIDQPSE